MDIDDVELPSAVQRKEKESRRVWVHEILQRREKLGDNTITRDCYYSCRLLTNLIYDFK